MTLEQIWERAHDLYELEHFGDAEAAVRAGLDLVPGHAPLYGLLAMCLHMRGKQVQAEAAALRAVALDPELDRGYYSLGLIFFAQNKPRLALEALEKCLRLVPDDPLAHALTAHVLLYTEQWEPALARALEALALDPGCAPAAEAYGAAQRALGQFEAAEELLLRFSTIHPEELGVVEELGWVALEQRNWGVALDCFWRAEVREGILETMRRQLPMHRWTERFPRWFPLFAYVTGLGLSFLYPPLVLSMMGAAFVLLSLRPWCNGYLWWRRAPLRGLEKTEFVICLLLALLALNGPALAGRAFLSSFLVLPGLRCQVGSGWVGLVVVVMLGLLWGSLWNPALWQFFNPAFLPVVFMLTLASWRSG